MTKIREFISSLGIDANRIHCIVKSDAGAQTSCAAKGTLADQGIGLLAFDRKMIKSIETNFTSELKFAVAHEVGHLIADDAVRGQLEINKKSCAARIYFYGVAMLGLVLFSSYSLVTRHLICSLFAKAVGYLRAKQIARQIEFKADRWAADRPAELAEAAIRHLQGYIPKNETGPLIQDWKKREEGCEFSEKMVCKTVILFYRSLRRSIGIIFRIVFHTILPSTVDAERSKISVK